MESTVSMTKNFVNGKQNTPTVSPSMSNFHVYVSYVYDRYTQYEFHMTSILRVCDVPECPVKIVASIMNHHRLLLGPSCLLRCWQKRNKSTGRWY